MTVDTAKAAGRRELHFTSPQDILDEAERLVAAEHVRSVGNWSVGQVLDHLARTTNLFVDGGSPFNLAWYMRLMAPLMAPLMKKRFLGQTMPAGFQFPPDAREKLLPDESLSAEQGLAALRAALERVEREGYADRHFLIGRMTRQEWDQLQMRHSELHMSFLVPES